MSYTNKSFYIKQEDVEDLHIFQENCQKDGTNGSAMIMKLIKEYNQSKNK